MTKGDCDNDSAAKLSTSASSAAMACRKEEIIFFSTSCFSFIILFFASSTDLVICSFDHSCRELAKMEIEIWSLKK
jgi:hypothetical protein